MIILDTCSWLKIQMIKDGLNLDLRDILKKLDIVLTHELNEELNYHLVEFINTKEFPVFPIQTEKRNRYEKLGFDLADASIICYAKERNCIIITEDGALLSFLLNLGVKTVQVSEFLLSLVHLNKLDKRTVFNLIKFLRERKNIKEKRLNKLKNKLAEFR